MKNIETAPFNPTEIWTPEAADLDEPIQQAVREMNSKNPKELIDTLTTKVEHSENGVAYAVMNGNSPYENREYSDTEALVMLNPFANAATPNMLVRAEFIREVAKFSDIRDADGKLKPVVMLASPGLNGSAFKLSPEERKEVRSGELGPAAKELLHAVSEKEIGQISLLGFSQGADMALAGARKAYSANLDTQAVAVGDPAGTKDRSGIAIGMDFMQSGGLKPVVEATGLEAQKKALGFGYGAKDFLTGFIPSTLMSPLNRTLWKGLGANSFEARVQEILDEGQVDKLVVAYGAGSAIPKGIEPAIANLYDKNGEEAFTSIKVEKAKHTWGDQLNLLAKLYMRALE